MNYSERLGTVDSLNMNEFSTRLYDVVGRFPDIGAGCNLVNLLRECMVAWGGWVGPKAFAKWVEGDHDS